MGKKAIKCMALALSASVLVQGQPVLAMASPMEVAPSSRHIQLGKQADH